MSVQIKFQQTCTRLKSTVIALTF